MKLLQNAKLKNIEVDATKTVQTRQGDKPGCCGEIKCCGEVKCCGEISCCGEVR